jgi:DNA-binding transcriptional ArsR family regulator
MSERFRGFLLAEKAFHEQALARIRRELEALGTELPARASEAILAILRDHPKGLDVPQITEVFEDAGRTVSRAALSQALSRFARAGVVERLRGSRRGVYRLVEGVAEPAVPADEAPLVEVPVAPGAALPAPEQGPEPRS